MRTLFLCAAMVFNSIYCSAITVDEMIEKYGKAAGVMVIDKKVEAGMQQLGIGGLQTIILNDSPQSVKDSLSLDINSVKDNKFDIFIKKPTGKEKVLVLKTKDEIEPKRMFILAIDGDDYVIVDVEGEIDFNAIGDILEKQ